MTTTLPLPPGMERPATDDPTIGEVDDVLWAKLAPRLVITKPRTKPGRPRTDDRPIFDGRIWLARTGSQWAMLPRR
jgi:transposase